MGRANSKIKTFVKTETKYLPGEVIRETIVKDSLVPIWQTEVLPGEKIYVPGKDSIVYQEKFTPVDSAAIISAYTVKNEYQNTLFDNDTAGKLTVNSTVQFNSLTGLSYEFKPMTKQVTTTITKERKRLFTPFVTASYNTFNQAGAGVGIYVKGVGVGAKYIKDLNTQKMGYEGGLFIKF
ncbi:hypothetical protein GCM10027051_31160 [Niabella terrae]